MRARPSASEGRRRPGFTLIEVMVALGLFALISVAGFTLLNGVINTRDRLDGRLDRIAELQRALYVVALDLEAIADAPIQASGDALAFNRRSERATGGQIPMRYALADGVFQRTVGVGAVSQRLIVGVTAVEWSFYAPGLGWRPDWPASLETAYERPRAVALTVTLAGGDGDLSGRLRRVIELPSQP